MLKFSEGTHIRPTLRQQPSLCHHALRQTCFDNMRRPVTFALRIDIACELRIGHSGYALALLSRLSPEAAITSIQFTLLCRPRTVPGVHCL